MGGELMHRLIKSSLSRAATRLLGIALAALFTAPPGCSWIPAEGPSRRQVVRNATTEPSRFDYSLIRLDRAAADTVGQFYATALASASSSLPPAQPIDRVGPG